MFVAPGATRPGPRYTLARASPSRIATPTAGSALFSGSLVVDFAAKALGKLPALVANIRDSIKIAIKGS